MDESKEPSLRDDAPRRVLDGFGRAVSASCRYEKPADVPTLMSLLLRAKREGLTVTFRGSGRSYGDAALNRQGIVVDMSGLHRIIRWDPKTNLLEAESGVTVEALWKHVIADGFWPVVVPGTMYATLGGCLAVNVHGKNNFQQGTFGDHVVNFDLLMASGEILTCSRDLHPEVFFGTIGGMGLLGAVVRMTLRLRKVQDGEVRVTSFTTPNLRETLDQFERLLPKSDYVVGWVDAFAKKAQLGRSEIHAAAHLTASSRPSNASTLTVEAQNLPSKIFGFPHTEIWKFMRPFANPHAMALVNAAKFHLARTSQKKTYLQSHAAFAFLLDYIPDWRLAYGDGGFIQHQLFVPDSNAYSCIESVLKTCQKSGHVPYLAVLKRHRPDEFLLTHALDGWSLALDFRITEPTRGAIWTLLRNVTSQVLEAGGKFYFAKDAVLTANDVERAYGRDRVAAFLKLKEKLDPTGLFGSDLAERVFSIHEP